MARRTKARRGKAAAKRRPAPAALPRFVEPELATLVDAAPEGGQWLHEAKFDGYRILCRVEHGRVRLLTRRGHDWTRKFPRLAAAAGRLRARQALLDGEVVVFARGVTSFMALQRAMSEGRDAKIRYRVFDLLHLDGRSLKREPLEARKKALTALVRRGAAGPIGYSGHVRGGGGKAFRNACRRGLEGIVSKRRDAPYRSGRGHDWLKTKCVGRQEFVIGGFTRPKLAARGVGALLLGQYRGKRLVYAGRVGTGFDNRNGPALRRALDRLRAARPPFASVAAGAGRSAIWVHPRLVCEVEFLSWTRDGLVRHASFQGRRTDKPARAVHRELAKPRGRGRGPRDKR
jgi:bifunctional non-homologous end joining protein LigD